MRRGLCAQCANRRGLLRLKFNKEVSEEALLEDPTGIEATGDCTLQPSGLPSVQQPTDNATPYQHMTTDDAQLRVVVSSSPQLTRSDQNIRQLRRAYFTILITGFWTRQTTDAQGS